MSLDVATNTIMLIFVYLFVQGLVDVLCEACEQLKWKAPTKIQREAIPVSLQG